MNLPLTLGVVNVICSCDLFPLAVCFKGRSVNPSTGIVPDTTRKYSLSQPQVPVLFRITVMVKFCPGPKTLLGNDAESIAISPSLLQSPSITFDAIRSCFLTSKAYMTLVFSITRNVRKNTNSAMMWPFGCIVSSIFISLTFHV